MILTGETEVVGEKPVPVPLDACVYTLLWPRTEALLICGILKCIYDLRYTEAGVL
jgi:hypothetical protein